MNKIVFCYFAPKWFKYTPIDIGYILAMLKQKGRSLDSMEIIRLEQFEPSVNVDPISQEVERILSYNPQAVIFFVESVFWSRVFSWNRAKMLSFKLREAVPPIMIGVQSFKASKSLIDDSLKERVFDFVIKENPEASLMYINDILEKKKAPGVFRLNNDSIPLKEVEHNKYDRNLDNIPSPYLTGVLDNFLEENQKMHLGCFQSSIYSSRGCAFGCYYCWRSVKSERKVDLFSERRFYDEIEYLHKNFNINDFFILDDAFPLSIERLSNFCDEFEKRKKITPTLGSIKLHSMCRAEKFTFEVVEFLKKINMTWIQMGLQTVNPELQHYMNRNISVDKFKDISMWLKAFKIDLCLDIVVGLPYDSIENMKKTLDFAVSLFPQTIRINRFFLNPGTLFYQEQKKYGIIAEKNNRKFSVPYVQKAAGIDEKYFKEAKRYILKKKAENKNIRWLDFLRLI